jgi:zinc/manganese transport system substrate-binding protein
LRHPAVCVHFHLTLQRTLGTPYVSGHGQRHPRPRGRQHERAGDLAKQIGGDHVMATSIMPDPDTDPHLYEADASAAAALSNAQLMIENGLGYDAFMDKLLGASPNPGRQILNVADTMQVSGPDANQHIWYDIAKIPAVAAKISD